MTSLFEHANQEELARLEKRIAEANLKVDRLRTENKSLRVTEKKSRDELLSAVETIDTFMNLSKLDAEVPKWLDPKRSKDRNHAMLWTTWSDLHLDEVVDYEEMMGLNEFNREIAEERFQNLVDGLINVPRTYMSGLDFDGIVVALGGDIVTGSIHEELAETNEAPVPETIVHWAPILASGLKRLADEYGKVVVPCVDGNHDRSHKKIRYKKRAQSSFAWIIYHAIAWLCEDDDRIVFNISKSPDLIVPVYGTKFLLTHGDAFRGGGGVGGIFPPMLRWATRKLNTLDYDIAVIGHWHQLLYSPLVYVNGSLKGYDEYAKGHGFGYERAQQMLFVVTPENGVTMKTSIFADKGGNP